MRTLSTAASLAVSLAIAAVLVPTAVAAQTDTTRTSEAVTSAWNAERVMNLVGLARTRRQAPVADSLLETYRAEATGHVYFFLDREINGEPILLRADQVAVDLFWGQPDRTRQVIRGLRSEEQFPIRDFRYYLDRYTVIQNGFGDEIRVGEGRDVADVPHPLAPGAERTYSYRLADSLTIRLPGNEDLRVYEVQVRPNDFDQAAIVGSLFLERTRGDLVRLAFTFTPAAYLDERNERVEVTLENGLWEGRYWLPREQRLLVRRELPQLDLDVGTVIRAVLRVSDYEFNPPVPAAFFGGREVVVAGSADELARYDFEEGLYDGLPDVGIAPGRDVGSLDEVDVDDIAGRILRDRFLRGVPALRLYAPGASSVLRYDRAEGLVTAAGVSLGVGERQVTTYGGYAWGAEHVLGSVGVSPLPGGSGGASGRLFYRLPVELGLGQPAGVLSSVSAAAFGTDYRDLYFVSGGTVAYGGQGLAEVLGQGAPLTGDPRAFAGSGGAGERVVGLRVLRHDAPRQEHAATHAPINDGARFRPVLPTTHGTEYALFTGIGHSTAGPFAGRLDLSAAAEVGHFEGPRSGDRFGRVSLSAKWSWNGRARDRAVALGLRGIASWSGPIQHATLLGGLGTLPGHPYHRYLGERVALLDLEAWRTVVPRWLRVRAIAAAAAVSGGSPLQLEASSTDTWTIQAGDLAIPVTVGLGLGVLDGILRVDYALGVSEAASSQGELTISLDPRLHGIF